MIVWNYRLSSHWLSCDLLKGIILSDLKLESEVFSEDEGSLNILKDANLIYLVDHRWFGERELNFLSTLKHKKIKIQVYGDLTLKLTSFQEHLIKLKDHDLTFLVLSKSQKNLIEDIFPQTKGRVTISVLNHPGKKLNEISRNEFRKKYNLGENKVYGYAGRISPQKNILELMSAFLRAAPHDSRLVLTGEVHPHPFWQFTHDSNPEFLAQFKKLLLLGKDRITWTGKFNHEEMEEFYSGIDTYISASTFHDEDYSLSLSEALSYQRPCVVTSWGGHLRVQHNPMVTLLNVEQGQDGFGLNPDSLKAYFQGQKEELKTHVIPERLDTSKRNLLLSRKYILKNDDGSFDKDMYQAIYRHYVTGED